ncbi:MAG: hypothetical protein ACOCPM_06420 [Bacteroidales bacterium]
MKSLFICILFLFFTSFYSFSNDSTDFSREGVFDYALIKNSDFYAPIRPALFGYTNVIRKTDLKKKTIPVRHAVASSYDSTKSFNWFFVNNIVFSYHVITSHHAGRRLGLSVNIVYREFESRDSIEVSQSPPKRIIENTVSVIPVLEYFRALLKEYRAHEIVEEKVNKFYDYLNFDIYFEQSDSLINFYMRDKDAFYIWETPLPEKSKSNTDWQLKKAYAAPRYDPEFIPRTNNMFYDSLKTRHNAITDTLFFDGHFKVLEQNNEKFIINREHGRIYHMGENAIKLIGKVLVTNNYPTIMGNPYFIEDRDHNRLIFFAPVEWEDTTLPKPKVYYMKEEEKRKKFRYVVD